MEAVSIGDGMNYMLSNKQMYALVDWHIPIPIR